MVQIPQYVQQEGLAAPSRDIPSVAQPTDGGIGQALSNLGGQISQFAEASQARQQRKDEFNARVSFDAYQERVGQSLIEAERSAPPDGSGIHDNFMLSVRSKETAKFLSTITNPEIRERYRTIIDTSDAEHWSNQAANTEWKISNKFSTEQLGNTWSKAEQGIVADPASVKAYVNDMIEQVDKAPDLTPAQREEMKQKIREGGPRLAAEALTTMDPEVAHYMRTRADNDPSNPNLPTETQRIDFLARRAASAMPDVDGAKLKASIAKHGGDVEAAFGDLADEMGIEEKDKPAFIETGMKGMGAARLISGKGGNVRPAGGGGSSAGLVSRFEGFRTTAYWDVNHWRVGYGSDTVTRADGTIERVTKNTRVTRADADRDLNRRLAETQNKIAGQVGEAWSSLSDGAKAAMTSVAYNYGSLPSSVVAAARTGDGQQIAQAITGLSGHNGGVNANRRKQEAAIAAGGSIPGGKVRVADASGTGGLTMNDAGPQYADGVPGGSGGFVAPAFQDMPADTQLKLQGQGTAAFTKAQQVQLAQDTTDEILSLAGASEDAPGDRKAAYEALDAISDADLRKDVAPLIESHFNRWDAVQKDQQEALVKSTWATVDQALAAGDTKAAFEIVKKAGLPPEDTDKLMTRIAKGPVQVDDTNAELEISALKLRDPEAFASMDIQQKYGNSLTAATIVKLQGEQATLAKKDDAAAKSIIETSKTANPIINDNLQAIGIDTSAKATPEDAQHANLIRSVVGKEVEKLQVKLGRPPLISEIDETVRSVMKAYPRTKPVPGMLWGVKDADVDIGEVAKAYAEEKLDLGQAADALRRKGQPVNGQTLQDLLDLYKASKQ